MGKTTIDPHSQKEHTKLYKIPKFGVDWASFDRDTAIWKCQNLQRNVWPSGRCVRFQIAVPHDQSKLANSKKVGKEGSCTVSRVQLMSATKEKQHSMASFIWVVTKKRKVILLMDLLR